MKKEKCLKVLISFVGRKLRPVLLVTATVSKQRINKCCEDDHPFWSKTLPPLPHVSNFNQFCQDYWGRVWNAPSTIVRTAYNKLSDLKFSKVLKYFFIWEKIHLMNNKYIENMLMALFFGLLRRSHKCIIIISRS